MRYFFLIIFIFCNVQISNANFLNKKPEGLLFIEDESIRKENPFLIFFDYNKDTNQITRNSFMTHDTYLFGDIFGHLKKCNNRWGGLPSRNDIAKLIKDISVDEFKVFNSGYIARKNKGILQCAPKGNNKEVFLEFVDEYLVALKLIVENKEKYLASIKSISPNEPNQVKETKNCDQSINKQKKIISSSITRKETKYDYKGTWKENLLLNHSNEKFWNYKEYKIKFLEHT